MFIRVIQSGYCLQWLPIEQPWNWNFSADAGSNACWLGRVVDGCWTFTESEIFSSGGRGTTGQLLEISSEFASPICWASWGVLKFSPPIKLLRMVDIFSFCWNDGLVLYWTSWWTRNFVHLPSDPSSSSFSPPWWLFVAKKFIIPFSKWGSSKS